jgi:hypothetical protein
LFATIAPAKLSASLGLDASVGASGPHDFAVREDSRTSDSTFTSTAFRLAFRDDRDTPLVPRRDAAQNTANQNF